MKAIIIALCIYPIGFLVTYGHAYNTRPATIRIAGTDISYEPSKGAKAVDAFIISAFWPLYISTIMWEK